MWKSNIVSTKRHPSSRIEAILQRLGKQQLLRSKQKEWIVVVGGESVDDGCE